MNRTLTRILAASLLVLLAPGRTPGQFDAWQGALLGGSAMADAIQVQGTSTVELPPTRLRMYLELSGQGKTLEEALADLQERGKAASLQVKAFGATEKTISVGGPSISDRQTQQHQQLEQMIRQRMSSSRRGVPEGLRIPKSFVVTAILTAEWPLTAQTTEAMLLETEALTAKVEDADLGGAKEEKELSPEEEEIFEEMTGMMDPFGDEEVEYGVPAFYYVAEISDEQSDKAMAKAFQKAKAQAGRLAQAAGVQLGPLVALSGGGSGGTTAEEQAYMYDSFGPSINYAQQQYLQSLVARQDGTPERNENESANLSPGPVRFAFFVQAAFAIKR